MFSSFVVAPSSASDESASPFGFDAPSEFARLAKKSLLLSIECLDERCLAVGERGHLFSSSGKSEFSQLGSPSQSQINDVAIGDKGLAYAVGEDGTVLRILEGKVSRIYSDLDADSPLFSVVALSSGEFLAAGAYGYCIKGIDDNWNRCEIDPEERHIYEVIQLSNGGRVAVGEAGLIAQAESGDADFELIESPYSGSLFGAVSLAGAQRDYVLVYGLRGTILFSDDGAKSFQEIPNPETLSLLAAAQVSDDRALVVGLGGQLIDLSLSEKKIVRATIYPGRPALTGVVFKDGVTTLTSDKGLLTFQDWQW